MVHPDAGRGVREDRLAVASPLPDAQSLSLGDRDAPGKPGGGDEMVSWTGPRQRWP